MNPDNLNNTTPGSFDSNPSRSAGEMTPPSSPPPPHESQNFWKYILGGILAVILLGVAVFFAYQGESLPVKEEAPLKIGIIVRGNSYKPGVEGFKAKMAELGYVEGKTVVYDVRFVENVSDLPAITSEVLANGAVLLHTYSTPATIEAAKQTKTIPIIFGSMGDAVASGLINSLQEPGTNVTGILSMSVETAPKRLELLTELYPDAKKIGFPYTVDDIPAKRSLEEVTKAAPKLGVTLVPYEITKEKPAAEVAKIVFRKDVDGIVVASDSGVWAKLPAYIEQAKKEKLPFAVFDKAMVESGGLVGYGPDYFGVGGQAAVLAKKIFGGADPAKLPIETPTKMIVALNLKTAEAIGLSVPDAFLVKVDYLVK